MASGSGSATRTARSSRPGRRGPELDHPARPHVTGRSAATMTAFPISRRKRHVRAARAVGRAAAPSPGGGGGWAVCAPGREARPPPAGASPGNQIARPTRTPVPGCLANLSQRLDRLPYGHPSSPYHVDGEGKPPPPRLKHLELAPPVADRPGELPAGPGLYDPDPGPDPTEPGALAEQLSPQDRDGPAAAGAAPG